MLCSISLHFLPIPTWTFADTSLHSQLDEFPSGAHWLCPAYGDEDATLYNNPDEPDDNLTISEKHRRIQEAAARIQISYKYSLILGAQDQFEEAEEWLRSFKEEMSKQLECYECLKEYYRARRDFLVVLDSFVPTQLNTVGCQ